MYTHVYMQGEKEEKRQNKAFNSNNLHSHPQRPLKTKEKNKTEVE